MRVAETVSLAIGGLGFHEYRDQGEQSSLPAPYLPFVAAGAATVVSRVHGRRPRPAGGRGEPWELLFAARPNWTMHGHNDRRLIRTRSLEAVGDRSFSRLDLFPRPRAARDEVSLFSYPLAELIAINLLARPGGLLLHACAIEAEGRALVCCGRSGIGKSTLAGIWQRQGYRILSDDRVIVRQLAGRLVAAGTPWHGSAELSAPIVLPLAGIFLLDRGRINRLTPLSGAQAVARLLQNSFLPFWDREAMAACLAFLEQCVRTVPCAGLEFRPDPGVIPFLLAGLGSASPATPAARETN